MMYIYVSIGLILLISGARSNDSGSCSTPNLYNEFIKNGNSLKEIDTHYFKCLASYDKYPILKLSNKTIANMIGMDFPVDEIAKHSIYGLTEGKRIDHSDLLPAFKKTCIYNSHLKEFGDQLSYFLASYELKLTCPLGLLWDIICTFTSCLQSDICTVDGETCKVDGDQENITAPCRSSVELELYCKRDFQNFLDRCADTMDDKATDSFDDTGCSSFNFIYQGLSSLQVVEGGVISAHCDSTLDEGNVTLTCFEQGIHLKMVYWTVDDEILSRESDLTISLKGSGTIKCHQSSKEIANIHRGHLYNLCNSNKGENNVDTHNDSAAFNAKQNNAAVSDTPPTTPSPLPDESREKWKDFYQNETIWPYDNNEKESVSFEEIAAFDNRENILLNVDKLSVAVVSVMGRLTPICGELWNKEAAQVFCRDAGAQVLQNWNASYVGSLHKTKNVKHASGNKFYQHYLRNITCYGNETKLIWCDHDGWYHHSGCSHDALVICSKIEDGQNGDKDPYLLPIVIVGVIAIACIVFSVLLCYFGKYKSIGKELRKVCYQTINGNRGSESGDTPEGTSIGPDSTNTVTISRDSVRLESSNFGWSNSSMLGGSVSRPRSESDEVIDSPTIIEMGHFQRLNSSEAQVKVFLWESENGTRVCRSCELDSRESLDNMLTEQFFLSNVRHPNIVKCLEKPAVLAIGPNRQDHTLYFFMEYLILGGLDKHLRSSHPKKNINFGHLMTVADATSVIVGMCRAVYHVHKLGYVHGDISTDNFFAFRNDDTGLLDVKLGDFETFYKPNGIEWQEKRCTHLYSAPEITLKEPKDLNGESMTKNAFKNDVWGLALVIWEVQSWVMCKNNRTSRANREQQDHDEPVLRSSFLDTVSRFLNSRIRSNPQDNYTCRRKMHVALLEKIDIVNPDAMGGRPGHNLMEKFYQRCHPHIGLPSMHPGLDQKFGWPLKGLLSKCLEVNPAERYSMEQVLRYILKYARSQERSLLSKYNSDLEKDLDVRYLPINVEDAEPVKPDPVYSPPTLQPLGQLYQDPKL
ncbi:hypothetical protein ACHWQZ_G005588 [Mnemiopsis leidyi]